MSKDNDKNRRQGFGYNPNDRIRNETAERQFRLKITQARKLFNEKKHGDAITILDPLKATFSERGEFLDLLGACYASAGYLYEAREIFTRALTAPPKHKFRDALNKYNLVRLCAETGSPFIAYEYSQQIDCQVVADALQQPSEYNRCRILVSSIRTGMAMSAREAKMPFDEYVTFSLFLDRGLLAMNGPAIDLDAAAGFYEEARKINPTSTTPYNNLAVIYLRQGKLEQALEKTLYLLEKLDQKEVHALSNTIRLLFGLNRPEEAQAYLKRLLAIKIKPSDNLVKLAEALIYFKEDQAIYDRLQPLVRSEKLFSGLKIVDKGAAEQTLIFEIVAAANAGNRAKAQELAWTSYGRFETHQILLDRTYEALKNMESGPLPGGRFIYWEPKALYPQAAQAYQEIEPVLLKLPKLEEATTRYEKVLRPFFAKFGQAALDYIAYLYWINRDPAALKSILTQTLACGVEGTVELVKSLAFEKIGDDKQRFTAFSALVEADLVGHDEPVTFWLNRETQNITFTELQNRLGETSKS